MSAAVLAMAVIGSANAGAACPQSAVGGPEDLSIARTIEIDASAGPIFGSMTRQAREPSFLKPMEVVLTFDDGPMPWVTKSILGTLDRFCTKATFFSVGKMALAYPETVKDILARGHTLGSHTFSHPFNVPRMKSEAAKDEIERGLAAVTTAAGVPVAAFFRFPGLSDSGRLLAYLQRRGIATFSVDVVSNDSYIHDKQRLIDWTLAEVSRKKGGIILFHDIKTTTAKALPEILAGLKARGYSVVHLTSKTTAQPLPGMMSAVAPRLAKASPDSGTATVLLPFYGAIGPEAVRGVGSLEVTSIAPQARARTIATPDTTKPESTKPGSMPSGDLKQPQLSGSGKPEVDKQRLLGWSKRTVYSAEGDGTQLGLNSEPIKTPRNGWITKVRPGVEPGAREPRP